MTPTLEAEPGSALSSTPAASPRQAYVEKHYRSLVKAVSWRATGTVDTIIISLLVTGQIKLAISIGFVELFTKVGLFYVHERVWQKISWGRAVATDDYTI